MMNNGVSESETSHNLQESRQEERPSTSTANPYSNNEWPNDIERMMEVNSNTNNINNMDFEMPPSELDHVGLPREIIFKKIKRMKIGRTSRDCTICFNPYNRGELIRKLPCKHIFHEGCVIPWLAKNIRCPNCRFDLKEFFSDLITFENRENI